MEGEREGPVVKEAGERGRGERRWGREEEEEKEDSTMKGQW